MREAKLSKKKRAVLIFECLAKAYPDVTTFLTHDSTFQLLIAVILSAQCTDERVNLVTPDLFSSYPTVDTLAAADLAHVESLIASVNYFRTKAKNIIGTAQIILRDFQGVVPSQLSDLIRCPGVGRKTANVVLGQAFGLPGITVDTHVRRLSHRLQFSANKYADKIELDLQQIWPDSIWSDMSTYLIVHGRRVCLARRPNCKECLVADLCPSCHEC